jgi:hypothetical protein
MKGLMNEIAREIAYLVALRGEDLLVVRDDPGKDWGLPHARILADVDVQRAEIVLGRHLKQVSVLSVESIPEQRLIEAGNVFADARVYICRVAPNTLAQSFKLAWFIRTKDPPYHVLSEEVHKALPFIENRPV